MGLRGGNEQFLTVNIRNLIRILVQSAHATQKTLDVFIVFRVVEGNVLLRAMAVTANLPFVVSV